MKDHNLPVHPHTDDDDCPEGETLDIRGEGGIVIQAPDVDGDRAEPQP